MLAWSISAWGNPPKPKRRYRKSVTLDGANPVALTAYGAFLCEQKRPADADANFAALSNPLFNAPGWSLHNAGSCEELPGTRPSAERDYRAALQANRVLRRVCWVWRASVFATRITCRHGPTCSGMLRWRRIRRKASGLACRPRTNWGDKRPDGSYGLKLRAKFPDSEEGTYKRSNEP